MRNFVLIVAIVGLSISILLTAGCGSDSSSDCGSLGAGLQDISISFQGFDEHVGQTFKVRIVWPDGDEMDRSTIDQIPGPDFNVRLVSFCGRKRVEFYADVDGDNAYDPPPTDHAWRLSGVNIRGDMQLVFPHDNNHVDIQFPD